MNDDDVIMEASIHYEKVEALVNSVGSDLTKELRAILLNELETSHSQTNQLLEIILTKLDELNSTLEHISKQIKLEGVDEKENQHSNQTTTENKINNTLTVKTSIENHSSNELTFLLPNLFSKG